MSRIQPVQLPQFGIEDSLPPISTAERAGRLAAATERMQAAGLDFLVVYADREHLANIAFLTGFEPRFEEALLLMDKAGRRALVVGNECMGYLPDEALGLQVVLHQNFSLMGQPRGQSSPIRKVLSDFGIAKGSKVGVAGWKYFDRGTISDPEHAIEIPAYMVDALRLLAGGKRQVRNANALLTNPQDGLRIINSAAQIAQFEYAAIRTSEGVLEVLRHMREGERDQDLEKYLLPCGLPLSCHQMVSFGDKALCGLASPSGRKAKLGDAFTIGFGVWGSLTARAGAVARGAEDLAPELREFYETYVRNYFDIVVEWYERIRVGAVAGEVYRAVQARKDAKVLEIALNPGHYIHLDEWVHSPFSPRSKVELRSGMALQADIIPISKGPFCFTNDEDGVALADETLRAEIARAYPACWKRIEQRRAFMTGTLGIQLDASVLPLGNMPAWLPPYALDLGKAMVKG
jgi:Xaa-Pro aminopeptidase